MRLRSSLLLAAALLSGCAPPAVLPSPDPTAAATPSPVAPGVELLPFTSQVAPYVACYPRGWVVLQGALLDDRRGDMFVGPPGSTVNTIVTVVGEPAVGMDAVAYADAALANLRSRGIGFTRGPAIVVDGASATVITFARLTGNGQRYTVRETLWASRDRGWVQIVTMDPEHEVAASALADQMLACFRSGPRP